MDGEAEDRHQPVLLRPNTRCNNFQLYAIAGRDGHASRAEDVFKVAILETLRWLRTRFRAIDLPDILKSPPPGDYKRFSLSDLRPWNNDAAAYKLEIVWLPEEGNWALRLTEPDHGAAGNAAVPGRLIETNIAYKLSPSIGVECAWKTVVSEPQGTETPCEVFRLSCVKYIARNPDAGLYQGFQLLDAAHALNTKKEIDKLKRYVENGSRTLPVVLISEAAPESPAPAPGMEGAAGAEDPEGIEKQLEKRFADGVKPLLTSLKAVWGKNPDRNTRVEMNSGDEPEGSRVHALFPPDAPHAPEPAAEDGVSDKPPLYERAPELAGAEAREDAIPEALQKTVRNRMGFAQFFFLPHACVETFRSKTHIDIAGGDVLVLEPALFGRGCHRHTKEELANDPEAACRAIEDFVRRYPVGKDIDFGGCLFVTEALQKERDHSLSAKNTKKELLDKFQAWKREIEHDRDTQLAGKEALIEKQKENIARLKSENAELRAKAHDLEVRLDAETNKPVERVEYLRDYSRSLNDRPKRLDKAVAWAEKRFEGKLFFHPQAKKITVSSNINLKRFCDALEYLATEHRDRLTGRINQAEHDRRCDDKYSRPFNTPPTGSSDAKQFYKVKYFPSPTTGKPMESTLDRHLVSGTSQHLFRIYFLYGNAD
ncbi:MAG: hypothetical protein LBT74_01960 [Acidobacteriota bacterium]|jgi:hypothetical protein|nr:hypothetical protein [Acidobacteriota bacterium]